MGKVIGKCRTIEDEALETNLPLGLGSLLATLKHMVAAERVWLDRWRFHSKHQTWSHLLNIVGTVTGPCTKFSINVAT